MENHSASINVDLKDYLILVATCENFLPLATLHYIHTQSKIPICMGSDPVLHNFYSVYTIVS